MRTFQFGELKLSVETIEEMQVGERVRIEVPIEESRTDFFRDILPKVAELVKVARQQGIVPEMPERGCMQPEYPTILFQGVSISIWRHYNIETNKFSAHLILWGWKADGAAIGTGVDKGNVQRS